MLVTYHPLKYDVGYWVVEDIDSILDFDVFVADVNKCEYDGKDTPNNPFFNKNITQLDGTEAIYQFLNEFYREYVNPEAKPTFANASSWSNFYSKELFGCYEQALIPHQDIEEGFYDTGIACNLWLTDEVEHSGTNLYKYHGEMIDNRYDFCVDPNHALNGSYVRLKDMPKKKQYINYSWEAWGFEFLGMAPSKYKTMTIYKTNVPHCAHIPYDIEVRHGCSFVYECDA